LTADHTLAFICNSNSSLVIFSKGFFIWMDALRTSISTASICRMISINPSSLPISPIQQVTFPPSSSIVRATALDFSRLDLSWTTTDAPNSANANTIALPIPSLEPVTSAVRPERLNFSVIFISNSFPLTMSRRSRNQTLAPGIPCPFYASRFTTLPLLGTSQVYTDPDEIVHSNLLFPHSISHTYPFSPDRAVHLTQVLTERLWTLIHISWDRLQ